MMTFSYYPGCTLKNKAKDLDEYARLSARALGVELEELNEWQCCGGVYPLSKDEIATKLSSVRALMNARDKSGTLVTLCSACHNVIKQVNRDMLTDDYIATRVNNYLGADGQYHGETKVIHFLEMLRDTVGFDEIKKRVVNPLNSKKIGAYYGCLLLRPAKTMQFDNAENPRIIEDLIEALGGEAVIYAERNECCGAYVTLEDKDFAAKRALSIKNNAESMGAELIVTACPLCQYNLKVNAADGVEVKYFTELLAEALGVKEGLDE